MLPLLSFGDECTLIIMCTVHCAYHCNERDGIQCVRYEMHIVLEQIVVKGVKPSSSQ